MGESSQQPEVAQKFKTILKPFFAVSTFVRYINRCTPESRHHLTENLTSPGGLRKGRGGNNFTL
jgi:hypothetical protein